MLLLDTNALIWFLIEAPLEDAALFEIAKAQRANALYVSPISAWEAALAVQKKNPAKRPDLNGQTAREWFRKGRQTTGAKLVKIGPRIALAAARVPPLLAHPDPGDCFIIATGMVTGHTIVTRDEKMIELSESADSGFSTIKC